MNRRHFLAGGSTCLGLTLNSNLALAQTPPPAEADAEITIVSSLPPLPADLSDKASEPPAAYVATEVVGTGRPDQSEIDKAYAILIGAPVGGAPIDVAQYFLAVGAGAYGEGLRPFAREWPVRANPMIMHFFASTQTKPEGDVTAWCAAFVNWCLLRAHAASVEEIGLAPGGYITKGKPFAVDNLKRYSTNNASSGSFRCWDEISSPNRGDIVVFRDAGTDGLTRVCRGSGHVAFFVKIPSSGLVQILGGNQSLKGSNGAVTIANASTRTGSRFLKYVSLKV